MKIFACLTLLNLLTFSTLVAQGDIDSIQVKKFYKLYEAHLKSYALNDYTTSFNTLLKDRFDRNYIRLERADLQILYKREEK